MSYNRVHIVKLSLIFLMLGGWIFRISACDMSAMIVKDGFSFNFSYNSTNFTAPLDYLDFVKIRSSAVNNYDGYGVFYYNQTASSAWYQTGMQTYYTKAPPKFAADWQWEMDAAINHLQVKDNPADIILSHARRGTGGNGNHPFRFQLNGKTYTFMHNGSISSLKEILFAETFGDPLWRKDHPSNWAPANSANSSDYIDSEVFFHWLMKNIIASDGSVLMGLRKSLALPVPGLNSAAGNTVHDNLNRNRLNFVFSDGEMLYVYRGTPVSGTSYNLCYKDNKSFWAIKTQDEADGMTIRQHQLVCLTKYTDPIVISHFSNPQIIPDCFIKNANLPVSGLQCLTSDLDLTAGMNLFVKANSILEVGSQCRIKLNNAKLIIEDNAELRLGNGSEVLVDGIRSALIIKGGGRLSGYRDQQNDCDGDRVTVKNGGQLKIGDNAKRSSIYSRSQQKWSGFMISAESFSDDYFINCDIKDISAIISDNYQPLYTGNLTIANCDLKNLNSLMVNNINQLTVVNSRLSNFDFSGLTIFASGAEIRNCAISNNGFDAVEASYPSANDLQISGSNFTQNLGHGINISNRTVYSLSGNRISENQLNGFNLDYTLPVQSRAAIYGNWISNNGKIEFSAAEDDYRLIYSGCNEIFDYRTNPYSRPEYLLAINQSSGSRVNVFGNSIPQQNNAQYFYPDYELFDFNLYPAITSEAAVELNSALNQIESHRYSQARTTLEHLVFEHSNSPESKSALHWLLHLEKKHRNNFQLFREVLKSVQLPENSYSDNYLNKIFISSYLAENDFRSAMPLLETSIATDTSKVEKVRSMLDMAYCEYNLLAHSLSEISFAGYSVNLENSAAFLPYWYKLKHKLNNLAAADLGSLEISSENSPVVSLSGNYPNPFNSETTIRFNVSAESQVEITVYNVSGQTVNQYEFGKISAGTHSYRWDAGGQKVTSGVYYYRIEADKSSIVSRMILLK